MPRLCTIDLLQSGYVLDPKKDWGPVAPKSNINTIPGLDFNPRFFFLLIKSILSDNFLFFLSIKSPNCRQKEFK